MYFRESTGAQGTPKDTLSNDAPRTVRTCVNSDGTTYTAVRLYNNTSSAYTVGQPYLTSYVGIPATSPRAIAPTVSGALRLNVVVIAVDPDGIGTGCPANSWGWFAYRGIVDGVGLNAASAISIGDNLKLAVGTSTTALVKDASRTADSVGVACAALASSTGTKRVELFGCEVTIAQT